MKTKQGLGWQSETLIVDQLAILAIVKGVRSFLLYTSHSCLQHRLGVTNDHPV